ncbi:MAG TPA: aspartyl/asparaginyl beta-hydroxylase domain-containing protein [Pseudolabrys sp.]|nr:aspartyl/asparaginyl beta-hydroxylase domain-containing protein [Pseudolabrys sp.]
MQLYDRAVGTPRAIYDRRIDTPAALDPSYYFPNAPRFTQQWTGIRDDAVAIARSLRNVPRFHDLMPEQTDISAADGRDWRMFNMKAYGVPIEQNLVRCPHMSKLLEGTPEAISAVFSFQLWLRTRGISYTA